jgi:hypothetical protein
MVAKPTVETATRNPGEVNGQWQDLRRPSSLDGSAIPNNAVLKKSLIIDEPTAVNVPATETTETKQGKSVLEPIIKQPTTPDGEQPKPADQAPTLQAPPVGESTKTKSEEPAKPTQDPALNGSQT